MRMIIDKGYGLRCGGIGCFGEHFGAYLIDEKVIIGRIIDFDEEKLYIENIYEFNKD